MKSTREQITTILIHVFLFLLVIGIIFPLCWLILNSLKTNGELFSDSFALPQKFLFENYIAAWNRGLSRYFINSILVSTISIASTVLLGALAAYGLSRFEMTGKHLILIIILGGLMLPEQVALVPLYKLLQKMRLYNTYGAMIVPYIAFRLPFAVFLMRAYFLSFPRDLEEAAYIDGCDSLSVFFRIILPISKPILASTAIMTLIFVWNEFIFALVFLEDESIMTIPIGLMTFQGRVSTEWTILLAGITIASLPMIVFYLILQRHFIRGLMAGSIKG